MKDHHINIFYIRKTMVILPISPTWAYCSAFGRTPGQEGLMELEKAKAAWIEAALAGAGKPVPKPRYRPAIYQSGRV